MRLPIEQFIGNISHKKVYFFYSPQLKETKDKHYFVCMGFDSENVLILSCFTSQMDKNIKYIEERGLNFSTLVMVKPTEENGLKKDCCVNCNNVFFHSIEEFKNMYEEEQLSFVGELEDNYYLQICIGLNSSDLIETEVKSKIIKIE